MELKKVNKKPKKEIKGSERKGKDWKGMEKKEPESEKDKYPSPGRKNNL